MSETSLAGLPKRPHLSCTFTLRVRLSIVEQIALTFFAYVTLAALAFHAAVRDIGMIIILNAVTLATLMALRRKRHHARWLATAADLFPALLILMAYRESALLLTLDPAHHLDFMFIQCDRVLLQNHFVQVVLQAGAPLLQYYLEFAYLLCYPLVPLGVAAIRYGPRRSAVSDAACSADRTRLALVVVPPASISARFVHDSISDCGDKLSTNPSAEENAGASSRTSKLLYASSTGEFTNWGSRVGEPATGNRAMDDFWAAVLLATLFCYAVYPFFPLTPPRVLFDDVPGPHVEPLLRKLNFWLLDHYSVQACIFPSGHVAAVTAVALAVRKNTPRLGVLFLFLAVSVALATVYGRYHYALDAVAGALVGVAAYFASNVIKNRGD